MTALGEFLIIHIEEVEVFDNTGRCEVVFFLYEFCKICVFDRGRGFYRNAHRCAFSDSVGNLHLAGFQSVIFYEVAGDIIRHICRRAVNL